jgi:hypothetical protein
MSAIVGASVFILGLIGFFFAWAAVDATKSVMLAKTLFAIASFPIFTLVSSAHFAETYFWQLATLNYLCWGLFAAWLTRLWKRN